jgi:hypothetical protein
MLPDPVLTSSVTGPLTLSVRSKVPLAAKDSASTEQDQLRAARAMMKRGLTCRAIMRLPWFVAGANGHLDGSSVRKVSLRACLPVPYSL